MVNELYHHEALEDLETFFGERTTERLTELASIMFKPEGLVGRRVERGLSLIRESGFVPIACARARFNRNMVREQWRVSGLVAVPKPLRNLVDRLSASGDSLYVLLERPRRDGRSACEALSELKGPSDPTRRSPHHLRSRLDSVRPLLTFVHAPDSLHDMVREFGLLFSHEERMAIVRTPLGSFASAIESLTGQLYKEHLEADLDVRASAQRIIEACRVGSRSENDGWVDEVQQRLNSLERIIWKDYSSSSQNGRWKSEFGIGS